MTTATAIAPEIQLLAIKDLEPHPKNPHGVLKKDDPAILDLKAKIEAVGQKVPCLVRPKGKSFELVLGHRRSFVRALLGFEDVPCIVEDMTDDMADVLVVQENDSHAPPNAFLEAEVVSDLLSRPGWTLESVSQHLGRSKRWVALRSNLKNLHPKIREKVNKGKLKDWPLEWLEDLARLTPEAQESLLSKKGDVYQRGLDEVYDRRSLDQVLGEKFHELGKAPWDLEDAKIFPKAGPCTTCPKTSLRAPGLFDEGDLDPTDPKSLKKAICRDSVCWQAKADAVTKARIAELKAKEPKAEILKDYHEHVPAGVKAREKSYSTEIVKEGTKGAKPVILLDEGQAKLVHVKERTYGAKPKPDPTKKPAADEDPKKALARSKKEIAGRREALLIHKVAGAIVDGAAPSHATLLGLVAAFSVDEDFEADELEGMKKAFELHAKLPAWDAAIWERTKGAIERTLEMLSVRRSDELEAFVEWIAAELQIDLAKLRAATLKDIPDPKWWPKDAADTPPEKPAKKKARK